uniref:Angiotensin-converting enzyme n=1 Tax=Culicoides sonorensis TaxID=179676 RepID=A0A336KF21_CULSO
MNFTKKSIITLIFTLIAQIIPLITCAKTVLSQNETKSLLENRIPITADSVNDWFITLNDQYKILSQITATIAWELSVHPSEELTHNGIDLTIIKSQWRNLRCNEGEIIKSQFQAQLTRDDARMIFLLCRGPKFTNFQASELNKILGKIFEINTETEVCLPKNFDICDKTNQLWDNTFVRSAKGEFFHMESRINTQKEHHQHEDLRLAIGPPIGMLYPDAVQLMNVGAQNNGYHDIGEVWREELEVPYLTSLVKNLMSDLKPLYTKLHAIARHVLLDKYPNMKGFVRNGLIPADLFGNMFAQDWSSLIPDLILPFAEIDLNERVRAKNWSPLDMVKRAEDFYSSMDLFPMTQDFWDRSVFEQSSNVSKCHGSAANMFEGGDYRMIVCAENSLNDFYTIVHEMGHIEYYMAYTMQPAIFQDGTTTAFQEAIGDAIFSAVMTPQHLSRLGLIEDKYLYPELHEKFDHDYLCGIFCNDDDQSQIVDTIKEESGDDFFSDIEFIGNAMPDFTKINEKVREKYDSRSNEDQTSAFDITLLLHMALSKIPQIPFAYIMDKLRWDLFDGNVKFSDGNDYYWTLTGQEMGIKAPGPHGSRSELFDAGVKFHFADNIPMIRYFLASFLQAQIFKGLCEVTMYSKITGQQRLPMALHRCDIYGSKKAGKILKKALSLGSSQHWSEVLYILTGDREIKSDALLEYYQPLNDWLENLILKYNIPYSWLEPIGKELIDLSEKVHTKLLATGYKLVEVEKDPVKLQNLLKVQENYKEVSSLERIARLDSRMIGNYDPERDEVIVERLKGSSHRTFGYTDRNGTHLRPYEALYLIEINDLIVYYNEVIVSIEQAYILFLGSDSSHMSFEQYSAYKTLLQSGLIVMKHTKMYQNEINQGNQSKSDVSNANFTKKEKIFDYLRSKVHFLNWDQIKCNEIDEELERKFNETCDAIKGPYSSSNQCEGPQPKKLKLESVNLPQQNNSNNTFLDSNEKYGYEKIFSELDVIGTVNQNESEIIEMFKEEDLKFDFDIFNAEDAKKQKLSHSNICKPNYYGKVIKFDSPIEYSLINALNRHAEPIPVMLIIVYDNLSISSFIC